jgi:site-specific DNA-methyltransferase (adenine-specific)
MTNTLYYGDCLDVLRELAEDHPQGIADLIYLDPPFNSKRDYAVLFSTPKGEKSDAQITAFEDTWHWGQQAADEFHSLTKQPNTAVAEMMIALRSFLGENDMMAYLTMMANRLLVMHRVLKDTGSLYLHCDPTASHYLKIVLDGVFGAVNFRSEIIWKRTSSHGNVGKAFGDNTDSLFYYTKTDAFVWNQLYAAYSEKHVQGKFASKDEDGRRYTTSDLRNPGVRPNLQYKYKASNGIVYEPHPNGWAVSEEVMRRYDEEGRLYFPKAASGRLRLKRYLDETRGQKLQTLWDDIAPVNSQAQERLGYPTQKPLALLERIIATSSNEGDVLLDPFCGCGTAVHAAEKLGRRWIGIDITHLAITLIEKRLNDAFPGLGYNVLGVPKDLGGARDLASRSKHQFEWWALSLVGAQPGQDKKKGADHGIDGLIFFQDELSTTKKIIVSVKGGDHVSVSMIRDLKGVLDREKAPIGLFVTLTAPTKPMVVEAAAAGFYESPHHGKYPRLQILTIEGLLAGTERPLYPDMSGGMTFKKAAREKKKGKQEGLFES